MANPYRAYLKEGNEKIKKQAVEQIISNALAIDKKKRTESSLPVSKRSNQPNFNKTNQVNNKNNENTASVQHSDLNKSTYFNSSMYNENLLSKYSNLGISPKKNLNYAENISKQNFESFMKFFKESCDMNGLITLDQKIDYFAYLRNNPLMNLKKENSSKSNIILLIIKSSIEKSSYIQSLINWKKKALRGID